MRKETKPLSLSELLTHQGEPVWICSAAVTGWAIFHSISNGGAFMQFNAGCNTLYTSEYNRTWNAYAYKPESQKQTYIKPDVNLLPCKPMFGDTTSVRIESDYAPGTFLTMCRTNDGDIILKISGKGEMRIATSGGQFHGKELAVITSAFGELIDYLYTRKVMKRNECP